MCKCIKNKSDLNKYSPSFSAVKNQVQLHLVFFVLAEL